MDLPSTPVIGVSAVAVFPWVPVVPTVRWGSLPVLLEALPELENGRLASQTRSSYSLRE
jgi:hypothetical protein